MNSLLNQTKKNFEIILVDDGSTDGSSELCRKYANNNENVQVLSQKNSGSSAARNAGIAAANNAYIVFLDADDYFDYDAIEILDDIIEKENPDCICFGWKYITHEGTQPDAIACVEHGLLLNKQYIHSVILPPLLNLEKSDAFIFDFAVNKVYKRSILQKYNIYFDETRRIWEDRPFVVEYLKYCNSFYSLNQALYNYVQTTASLSSKYYLNFFDIILENYRHYTQWYAGEYDFDNQYSNDYWCHSIENMMLRSLNQTENFDKIQENMFRILDNPQVQHWYAKRAPQDDWERTASRLVVEKKYAEVVDLYRKKLIKNNDKKKIDKYIYQVKQFAKRLLNRG
jgi:glycosyltransferase involved in cell wall biosynthesis